ncbi:MAG: phage head closure protein [Pseudomonadota bacterium]
MRPGELRHRLVLQEAVRTDDGGGGAVETWQSAAELWAAVEPLGGDEPVRAEKLEGNLSHRVTIRWREGVLPSMRFLFGVRILEIDHVVSPRERRRLLVCRCVERTEG